MNVVGEEKVREETGREKHFLRGDTTLGLLMPSVDVVRLFATAPCWPITIYYYLFARAWPARANDLG